MWLSSEVYRVEWRNAIDFVQRKYSTWTINPHVKHNRHFYNLINWSHIRIPKYTPLLFFFSIFTEPEIGWIHVHLMPTSRRGLIWYLCESYIFVMGTLRIIRVVSYVCVAIFCVVLGYSATEQLRQPQSLPAQPLRHVGRQSLAQLALPVQRQRLGVAGVDEQPGVRRRHRPAAGQQPPARPRDRPPALPAQELRREGQNQRRVRACRCSRRGSPSWHMAADYFEVITNIGDVYPICQW